MPTSPPKRGGWIVIAVLLSPLWYLLAYGPTWWLLPHRTDGWNSAEWLWHQAYAPVHWLGVRCPAFAQWLDW